MYENDKFEYELGLEPKLKHIPAMRDRGEIAWVYAVYHLTSGGFGFEVMNKEDVQKHAKKTSQSYGSSYSPWAKWFDEMAKKTVVKKALKYAPVKTEFVRAIAADETIKSTLSEHMVDEEDETVTIDTEAETMPADETVPDGVDPKTGEVKKQTSQEKQDDAILEASLDM